MPFRLALKLLLFTLLIPGSVTVWIPLFVLPRQRAFDLGPFKWLGLLPLALGAPLLLRCIFEFGAVGRGTPAPIDPPQTLVVSGFYRRVRNPMYVGVLLMLLGETLLLGWRSLIIYTLCAALAFHLFVVFYEEPHLRKVFGASYNAYCRAVPRWLPRLRPIPPLSS